VCDTWQPTHVAYYPPGRFEAVMVVPNTYGPAGAVTLDEYNQHTTARLEQTDTGWLYAGRPFRGVVTAVPTDPWVDVIAALARELADCKALADGGPS